MNLECIRGAIKNVKGPYSPPRQRIVPVPYIDPRLKVTLDVLFGHIWSFSLGRRHSAYRTPPYSTLLARTVRREKRS
jgi:hypothetical protein